MGSSALALNCNSEGAILSLLLNEQEGGETRLFMQEATDIEAREQGVLQVGRPAAKLEPGGGRTDGCY